VDEERPFRGRQLEANEAFDCRVHGAICGQCLIAGKLVFLKILKATRFGDAVLREQGPLDDRGLHDASFAAFRCPRCGLKVVLMSISDEVRG